MKTTFKIAFAAASSAIALPLFAAETTGDDAKAAVAGWVNLKAAVGEDFAAKPTSVKEYQGKDGKGKYYVVELEGGGFVVASGDTEINPVLAYSKEGTWVDDVKQNPLLAMLPLDVAAATEALGQTGGGASTGGRASAGAGAASKSAKLWAAFKSAGSTKGGRASAGAARDNVSDVRVKKLLTTQWNQGTNTENLYIPHHWPCGCVATAGAQLMKFWNWPQNETALTPVLPFNGTVGGANAGDWNLENGWRDSSSGSYTQWSPAFGGPYNWSAMTDKPSNGGWPDAYAVSQLTRDVGLACHMSYASGGSGAQTSTLYRRLTDQFGYANACYAGNLSDSDGDDRSWKRAILASLNAGLPCGVSIPGHAIVADGYGYYGDALYVHFNLGWGGSSDAWYSSPFTSGMTGADPTFTTINSIIYNLYPQGPAGATIVSGRVLDTAGSPVKTGNKTVVAKNTDSDVRYTAVSTNAIYALVLPEGNYDIGYEYSSGTVFFTNMEVSACRSLSLVNSDDPEKQIAAEKGGSYYPNTGAIKNIYDMDLKPAAITAPAYSTTWGTTFYSASATVSLSSSSEGGKIYYTTDGSEPTTSSTLYTGPIALTATTTIKAKTFYGDFHSSSTMTATFTKGDYEAEFRSTKDGKAAHWIDEKVATHNVTGAWTPAKEFVDGRISVDGLGTFVPSQASKGKTVTVKAAISTTGTYGVDADAYQGVRAAVRICKVNGSLAFQVYTSDSNGPKWVAATGATPAAETEYEVRVVLDTQALTYQAYVRQSGGSEAQLTSGGNGTFPFATLVNGGVKRVSLDGDGSVSSIEGSYERYKAVMIKVM
ncbi:MAG: C10 family peptidase [Kiritimatiellae bacterium]|nr:C10 family peptidase [Kiritimatiellia bacterium]